MSAPANAAIFVVADRGRVAVPEAAGLSGAPAVQLVSIAQVCAQPALTERICRPDGTTPAFGNEVRNSLSPMRASTPGTGTRAQLAELVRTPAQQLKVGAHRTHMVATDAHLQHSHADAERDEPGSDRVVGGCLVVADRAGVAESELADSVLTPAGEPVVEQDRGRSCCRRQRWRRRQPAGQRHGPAIDRNPVGGVSLSPIVFVLP